MNNSIRLKCGADTSAPKINPVSWICCLFCAVPALVCGMFLGYVVIMTILLSGSENEDDSPPAEHSGPSLWDLWWGNATLPPPPSR